MIMNTSYYLVVVLKQSPAAVEGYSTVILICGSFEAVNWGTLHNKSLVLEPSTTWGLSNQGYHTQQPGVTGSAARGFLVRFGSATRGIFAF